MLKLIILMFVSLFVFGCASPDFNYSPVQIEINEPSIKSINVARIGDVMLKRGRHSEHDAIFLPNTIEIGSGYDLHSGYYLKKGEDEDTETFFPSLGVGGGMVTKNFFADSWQAIMIYKNTQTICIITIFNIAACEDNEHFVRNSKPNATNDSYEKSLIYNGKIGEHIQIGFMEYSNNYETGFFSNSLKFDISLSKIIRYQEASVEIIEASSEHIKYKVINNFDGKNITK